MSFASFSSINEKFSSLLNDYFNIGRFSLNLSTNKTVGINISANHQSDTKALEIDAENKISIEKINVDINTKFSTSNVLTVEAEVKDLIIPNSGHVFALTNEFNSTHRQALMKNFVSGENYNGGVDIQFLAALNRPIVTLHSLFGYQNYFIGGRLVADFHEGKSNFTSKDLCMGFGVSDFTFHGAINFGKNTNYEASVYQNVNDKLKLGFHMNWDKNTSDITGGICGHYQLSTKNSSFIKFKSEGMHTVALAYGFDFRKGIAIAFSGSFNHTTNKVDLGLQMNLEQD